MKMTKPELKVVRFASEDVIATSVYYDQANNMVIYGSMYGMPNDEGSWMIGYWGTDSIESSESITNPDHVKNQVQNGTMADYGHSYYQVYDAYKGSDGYYYTKGASYAELYSNNGQ